jgi:hypothetical protein
MPHDEPEASWPILVVCNNFRGMPCYGGGFAEKGLFAMDGIFISYRRDDSAGYAGRLYDRLVGYFGAERVFMDVEGIEPGLDFVEAIERAVGSCRVLIAVIGDEWTTATDASGRRRLDDPNDFIRLETGSALQRGIRVVPVLVGDAVMPLAADLPEMLKPLTRRQAIEINHKQWEASTGELIRTLEGILKPPAADAASQMSPSTSQISARVDPMLMDTPGNAKSTQGNFRRWVWPGVFAAAMVTVVGLWIGQGIPVSDSESDKQSKGDGADPGVVTARSLPKTPPPIPVVSKPNVDAAPEVEPSAIPPAEPIPVPTVSPPVPAPVIREFRVESGASRTSLCYRISHAEIVILSPYPGEVGKVAKGCVDVNVDKATTFTLTARNGERITRKTLMVVPRPLVVSAPPVRQPRSAPSAAPEPVTTMAPPVSAPSAVAGSQLPIKGERWIYRSSGKWPTSPKRRFEIVAQSVDNGLVTDQLRVMEPEGGGEVGRSHGSGPGFIAWNAIGAEFSPYLGAYVALAQMGSLKGFPTPDTDSQWRQWYSTASVIGQESVSVPAGTFTAFKVEVSSSRAQTGSFTQAQIEPVRVRYLIWYAPQVKRYVRMQRVIKSADGTESENDIFELVSHRLP